MPNTYKKKYSSFSAKIILGCLLACFFLLLNGSITCKAETKTYTNKSTGYQVIVEDDANLLTDEEETTLGKEMAPITTYGSVAFKSIDYNPYYSTEDYIRSYYRDTFGSTSATVFLIDMDNRNIWIHSNGTIYETITKSYANTITDNVYKYASDGDYYTCAFTAFGQINTLLEGRKIAQPMKYISNAFLAVIIALLLNYFLVRSFSRAKRPSKTDLLGKVFTQCNIVNPNVRFIRQSRVYSPPSSSGSGGSSGGGGFPGIPLCVLTGRETLLVDSVKKKVRALEPVAEELGVGNRLSTYGGRIEDLALERPREFSVLTARALSSLGSLLELASPLLRKGGRLVCYKAQPTEEELEIAFGIMKPLGFELVCDDSHELSDGSTRRIFMFQKAANSRIALPRRVGMAQRNPLTPADFAQKSGQKSKKRR